MNTELKVLDLEKAREKLKHKKAELVRRMIVRDTYFDKKRFEKNEIIMLRNLSMLFPSKKNQVIIKYENAPENYSISVNDFDNAYDILKNLLGNPVLDFVWFGETYKFNDCKIELRNVRHSINYIIVYGKNEEIIKILKELDLEAEPLEDGALKEIQKVKT